MLPVLQVVGAGLSAISALKNLTSSSNASAPNTAASNTGTSGTSGTPATSGATATDALASTLSGSKTTATDGSALQDRFLKLLVTQMKNQDPLNPMDNAQITTQLAQISTVGGIDKLNSTLATLSSSMLGAQSLQSSAIIGRDVYASGSSLVLADGKATGAFELKQDADRAFVQISDSSGALVRTLDLGAAKAGMSAFEWDGKTDAGNTAKSGTFSFQVTAAHGGATIPAEPMMAGRVDGVSLTNGIRLNLQGGGDIGMSDVKRIL
jgi:flagellar basal-body rod modification protein FlgD